MSSDCSKYDHLLLEVLQSEGQIVPFLDEIFSFLYRRTDFYKIQHDVTEKQGFPPGYAETITQNAFFRYHTLGMQEEEEYQKNMLMSKYTDSVPPAVSIVEISDDTENIQAAKNVKEKIKNSSAPTKTNVQSYESYNGAVRETFSWSQNATDIDVHIKVPIFIKSGRSVRVNLTTNHLKVCFLENSDWKVIIDDDLLFSVNAEETMWNLVPGEHIFIAMEKLETRWWDSLLKNEPKISMSQIDNSQLFEDLDLESQSKIQEIMFNEQQKAIGKPTIEQTKLESALKEAWDKDGSPFKGQPFDPGLFANLNTGISNTNIN